MPSCIPLTLLLSQSSLSVTREPDGNAKLEQDSSFALSTYEQVSPYIVTDCSGTVLTDMMDRFGQYTLKEIVSPEGENVLTEKYYEFHVEEALLDELILRLFYAPK